MKLLLTVAAVLLVLLLLGQLYRIRLSDRLTGSLKNTSQQVCVRCKRQQQPCNNYQPNIILPLSAYSVFQKMPEY